MTEHDLSQTLIPYLDRHLAFPLLTHLVETGLYPAQQIFIAQYGLAKATNMFDYAANLFAQIYPDKTVPQGHKCILLLRLDVHLLQNSKSKKRKL